MWRSWESDAGFQARCTGPTELWDFLLAHGDGIIEVPADRWSLDRYYDPDPDMPGRMYTRSGGFLQDSLWDFDPEFFGISPREASIMDPQQRLLLEVTQEAMDDAGVSGRVAGRPVGVYIGAITADNMMLRQRAHHPGGGRPPTPPRPARSPCCPTGSLSCTTCAGRA